MVTAEEQRAVQKENFKDDERFWCVMQDLNAASAEEHKSLIAAAEAKLKRHKSAAPTPAKSSRPPKSACSAFSGARTNDGIQAGRIRQAQTSST